MSIDRIRFADLSPSSIPLRVSDSARRDAAGKRWEDRGYKQLGRIYIHHATVEELDWLVKEWQTTGRSQIIDMAIRRLYQQTKQGLTSLDFSSTPGE